MTFVKLLFVLLIMVPVAILMWYLVNKLIVEFTNSVKRSRVDEDTKKQSSGDFGGGFDRGQRRYAYHESLDKAKANSIVTEYKDAASPGSEKNASQVKQAVNKRKRRKERIIKRKNNMKKDEV